MGCYRPLGRDPVEIDEWIDRIHPAILHPEPVVDGLIESEPGILSLLEGEWPIRVERRGRAVDLEMKVLSGRVSGAPGPSDDITFLDDISFRHFRSLAEVEVAAIQLGHLREIIGIGDIGMLQHDIVPVGIAISREAHLGIEDGEDIIVLLERDDIDPHVASGILVGIPLDIIPEVDRDEGVFGLVQILRIVRYVRFQWIHEAWVRDTCSGLHNLAIPATIPSLAHGGWQVNKNAFTAGYIYS